MVPRSALFVHPRIELKLFGEQRLAFGRKLSQSDKTNMSQPPEVSLSSGLPHEVC